MNDPIRQCPRCGERACDHDERVIADALALVGTGVINVDISVSYRWIASLRRHARTAFIELKREEESIGLGQLLCLLDLTGTLQTTSGLQFEQRAFVISRMEGRFYLATFWKRGSVRDPPKLWPVLEGATALECAAVIAEWLRTGNFVYIVGEEPCMTQ